MCIKPVLKMGDKKLATPSLPVTDFSDPALKELIREMESTMKKKEGVGIAAPQIGCNLRVILFGFEVNKRYPGEKPVPFTLLINPVIENISDEKIGGWEGCLSVPGLRGFVNRQQKIRYSGHDLNGNIISREAEGFHARVVQHEMDHINGILFPERIHDMKLFGFEDELRPLIWPGK